jgi:hypothetical protein
MGRAQSSRSTNGLVGSDGHARLGKGCARQAGQRFAWFAERLGSLVTSQGNYVGLVCERIVAFPVEHHPLENPDLVLIVRSARELVALADAAGYAEVVLPGRDSGDPWALPADWGT